MEETEQEIKSYELTGLSLSLNNAYVSAEDGKSDDIFLLCLLPFMAVPNYLLYP